MSNDEEFSQLSEKCSWCLIHGEYREYCNKLIQMAKLLRKEGKHMDETKALSLAYYFGLNCFEVESGIHEELAEKLAEAIRLSGMTACEFENLYLETVSYDSVPVCRVRPESSLVSINRYIAQCVYGEKIYY
jgi:hypothetical protein